MQCSKQLFDDLVGNGKEPGRQLDAERSRRLNLDDEFESSRLQRWQVGGLRAFEDFAAIQTAAGGVPG